MTAKDPGPRAPAHLGKRGRRLWRDVTAAFELSCDSLEVLTLAARCLDRIQTLEDELREAPSTVEGSKGQPSPDPLRAEVRAEALLAARLLAQLGLPPDEEGGSEWDGLTASARARKASRAYWDKRGGTR